MNHRITIALLILATQLGCTHYIEKVGEAVTDADRYCTKYGLNPSTQAYQDCIERRANQILDGE